jgi:hypothetical protein
MVEAMKNNIIPFLLGAVFGHYGVRFLTHVIYLGLIVLAFCTGKYFHV